MAVPTAGYAKGVYVASFIGMVPADHPRLVVLCAVNGTPDVRRRRRRLRRSGRSCSTRFSGWRSRRERSGDRRGGGGAPSQREAARGRGAPLCDGADGLVESAAMKLSELVEGVSGATVRGDPGTEIRGLAYHTRDVADGTLFFCVPGLSFDGHTFAAAAVEAGAAALVCERDTGVSAPQVIVPSVRRAMALMAARWYGDPSRALRVVGVTGTNGKTTTAHLVAGLFAAAGQPVGAARDGRQPHRRGRVPGQAHHGRVPRPAAHVQGDARRRGRGVRLRGQLARPVAGQGRRHRLRRGGVQQPDARPPGLPQGPRGLLRRQTAPLPAGRGAATATPSPSSTSATSSAPGWRASARRTTATTCGPARSTRRAPPAPTSSPATWSCAPTAPPSRSSARASGWTSA